MATHFIDFDSYSPGAGAPTGWTATSNNGTASWSVVAVGGGIGNVLQGTNTTSSPSTLTYDGANGDTGRGTCEVTAKFRMTTLSANTGFNCGVVGRAQAGSNVGYEAILRQQGTSNITLRRGISTSIATATNATIATPVINTFYWVRIQYSGTALRVRFWIDGSAEPGTWDIDTTDATYSDGPLGVLIHNLTGVYQFKYVGIGTNGDVAPLTAGGGGTAHHGAAALSSSVAGVSDPRLGAKGQAAATVTTAIASAARKGSKASVTTSISVEVSAAPFTPEAIVLPPTLSDLLSDVNAQIELVVRGQYLDENNVLHIEWVSQSGWADQVTGPAAMYIPPLLTAESRTSHHIEPLNPLSSFDVFGDITLSNNHLDYAGRYDHWGRYSVDGLDWIVYAVGVLANGTRVELAHVLLTPLFELKGIHIPEAGSEVCTIRCKDIYNLDTAIQPYTYSPATLSFPGTVAGVVDLGNNLNITGDQALSAWVYLNDTVLATQYILFKDSGGTTGYYLAVGLVGGGTIEGGVEIAVRGQSPALTTTAANVIRPFRWHRIDVSIEATIRRIDIDGVTAITTSSITGTPTSSATSLSIGRSLNGRIHRVLYWSNTRSNAVMSAEGRTPITGAESNLREAFLFHEGSGTTTASSKSGSVLTGTLGVGVLWDTAGWHYESILGQYEPYVLGTVPRVPVTWIDPPKQIGQVSKGPIALLSELQSNHNPVATANYTVNLVNGVVTVTSGALSGTYSATVTANNLWNSALLFNGTSAGANATITQPTGSKYLGAHFRLDQSSATIASIIVQWVGTGGMQLKINGPGTLTGVDILRIRVANDAGTEFTASVAIKVGKRYSALGTLDVPNLSLKLYVNGALAATTPVTGAFTLAPTAFSVGYRSAGPDTYFKGVIDEVVVGNTVATLAMAESYHALPVTSSFTGVLNGWHFNDATGLSAAPFAGAVSLTLVNTAWTAGRSAAVDLARTILYRYGFVESDFDTDSWFTALTANPADCGWLVSGGAKGTETLNVILGGLGFVLRRVEGLLTVARFEGLTGTVDVILDPDLDLQLQPVEPIASDPPIYLWMIEFATNNSKQDAANIAGSLATTDPDRYQYGSMPNKSLIRSDGSILERFPNAEPRVRRTALLNAIDADAEAARLLTLHKHGSNIHTVHVFVNSSALQTMSEVSVAIPEADLDNSDLIVIGTSFEYGAGTITVWRPAM